MYGRVFKNTNIDSGTENTKLIGGSLSIRIINREKKIKIRIIIIMIKFK